MLSMLLVPLHFHLLYFHHFFVDCSVTLASGKIGSEVVVPYRGEESGWRHLKVMGDIGQISAIPFDIRDPQSLVHV